MWALIITGIFSGAVQGPFMQVDDDAIKTMSEMSGDLTMVEGGFSTEEACKIQLAAEIHKRSFSMNGLKVTVKTVECRNTDAKVSEGRGPRS